MTEVLIKQKQFCACNKCGLEVKPGNTYIHGHNGVGENNGNCKNRKYPKPIPNHHLCACNKCGIMVASNRKYVSGHNGCERKGVHFTDEHIANLVIAANKPATKAKKAVSVAIANVRPEVKEKRRQAGLINGANPEIKARKMASQKITLADPEYKKRQSITQKEAQNRPEVRAKKSISLKIAFAKPESKEKRSKSAKIAGNRPEVKAKHVETNARPEVKAKRSTSTKIAQNKPGVSEKKSASSTITNKKLDVKERRSIACTNTWKDPAYKEKQIMAIGRGMCIFPNKPESLLKMILHEYHPGFKYFGDLSVVINGKNPDFVNEETKQIIEHYGDYWHDGEDPTDRAEIFAQAGYETCVIWENELKNLDHVIGKINRFCEIGQYGQEVQQ